MGLLLLASLVGCSGDEPRTTKPAPEGGRQGSDREVSAPPLTDRGTDGAGPTVEPGSADVGDLPAAAELDWRTIPSDGSLGFSAWRSRTDLEGRRCQLWKAVLDGSAQESPAFSFEDCGPGCEVAQLGTSDRPNVAMPVISTDGPSGHAFLSYLVYGAEPSLKTRTMGVVTINLTLNRVVAGLMAQTVAPPESGRGEESCDLQIAEREARVVVALDIGSHRVETPWVVGSLSGNELKLVGWYPVPVAEARGCYNKTTTQSFPANWLFSCGSKLYLNDERRLESPPVLAEGLGWMQGAGFGNLGFVTEILGLNSAQIWSFDSRTKHLTRVGQPLTGSPCYIAVGDRYLAHYRAESPLKAGGCDDLYDSPNLWVKDRRSGAEQVIMLKSGVQALGRYITSYGSFVAGLVEGPEPDRDYAHLLVRLPDGQARIVRDEQQTNPLQERIEATLDRDYLWLIGRRVTFTGNRIYRYSLDEFEQIGERLP